jgi:hypothetical protein
MRLNCQWLSLVFKYDFDIARSEGQLAQMASARDADGRAGGTLAAQRPDVPLRAVEAMAMAQARLGSLAGVEAAELTAAEQAECLRELERLESALTAARARVLWAFRSGGGLEEDGHRSARTWLAWQTRITPGAASGAVGWMRRLAEHPVIARALAGAELSASWARQLCVWSDLLPDRARADADEILVAAAVGGANLDELAQLAEEIRRRTAEPDRDGDDGFAGRALRLGVTYGGAGVLRGELSASCAAAVAAVLDALGKRAGPEDLRTQPQRHHDALEEACRRLVAGGGLPGRAGQPTQIQLHMSLAQLRGLPGAGAAEAAWAEGHWPVASPGADCDATIVPVVSGLVDPDLTDRLARTWLRPDPTAPLEPGAGLDQPAGHQPPGRGERAGLGQRGERGEQSERGERALRQLLVARAAGILSGPAGLAAWLRTGLLTGPGATVSLPLDIGAATETIPAHLRRAVTARDRHCRFPGCDQPPAASQVHHLTPRAEGGATSLTNLILLCAFHHLIAIHRWGWQLTLHPDGTITAVSPDSGRTLHSHSPPATAA